MVGAFIQPTSGAPRLTNKDLKTWLRKHKVAPYRMPDHYFIIGEGGGTPDELPVNASGKVVKAELKLLAQELVAKKKTLQPSRS